MQWERNSLFAWTQGAHCSLGAPRQETAALTPQHRLRASRPCPACRALASFQGREVWGGLHPAHSGLAGLSSSPRACCHSHAQGCSGPSPGGSYRAQSSTSARGTTYRKQDWSRGTGLSEHVSLPKSGWAFSARTVCPSRCRRTGQTWLESGPREHHPLHLSLPRVVWKHGRVKHPCLTDHACPPHGLMEPEVSELRPKAPSCGRQVRTRLHGPARAHGGRRSAPSGVQQRVALPGPSTRPVDAGEQAHREAAGRVWLRASEHRAEARPSPHSHLRPALSPQVAWCVRAAVSDSAAPRTAARQAPLPGELSSQNTGARAGKSKGMLLRSPPPAASLLWALHSGKNFSGTPPAVSSSQSCSSVAWRGHVLLKPPRPHIPGMQVSQIPFCSDLTHGPLTWGGLGSALDPTVTEGAALGGSGWNLEMQPGWPHVCLSHPTHTHTHTHIHTHTPPVCAGWDEGRKNHRAGCLPGVGSGVERNAFLSFKFQGDGEF